MTLKNLCNAGSRQFWEFAKRTASEVKQWPSWKRCEDQRATIERLKTAVEMDNEDIKALEDKLDLMYSFLEKADEKLSLVTEDLNKEKRKSGRLFLESATARAGLLEVRRLIAQEGCQCHKQSDLVRQSGLVQSWYPDQLSPKGGPMNDVEAQDGHEKCLGCRIKNRIEAFTSKC